MQKTFMLLTLLSIYSFTASADEFQIKLDKVCSHLNTTGHSKESFKDLKSFVSDVRKIKDDTKRLQMYLESECKQPSIQNPNQKISKPLIKAMVEHFYLAFKPGIAMFRSQEDGAIKIFYNVVGKYIQFIGYSSKRVKDRVQLQSYLDVFTKKIYNPRNNIKNILHRTSDTINWVYYAKILKDLEANLAILSLDNNTKDYFYENTFIGENEFKSLLDKAKKHEQTSYNRILAFKYLYKNVNKSRQDHFKSIYKIDNAFMKKNILTMDWISIGVKKKFPLAYYYAALASNDNSILYKNLEISAQLGLLNAKRMLAKLYLEADPNSILGLQYIDELADSKDPYAYLVKGEQALKDGKFKVAYKWFYKIILAESFPYTLVASLDKNDFEKVKNLLVDTYQGLNDDPFLDILTANSSRDPFSDYTKTFKFKKETILRAMTLGSKDAFKVSYNYALYYGSSLRVLSVPDSLSGDKVEYTNGSWFSHNNVSDPKEIHPLIKSVTEFAIQNDISDIDIEQLNLRNVPIKYLIGFEINAPILYWYQEKILKTSGHEVNIKIEHRDFIVPDKFSGNFIVKSNPHKSSNNYNTREFTDLMSYVLLRTQIHEGENVNEKAYQYLKNSTTKTAEVFLCRINKWINNKHFSIHEFYTSRECEI